MPDLSPCGRPSHKSLFRAVAAFLLLLTAFRPASPLGAAAAIAFGGCLWWVAQRQTSQEAALLAVAFYVGLPLKYPAPALGIFAMLYTATGVAHALQGPRRKWPPRIALMAVATVFTAVVDPRACAVALLLSFFPALWLAERCRLVLLLCFVLWAGLAVAAALLLVGDVPGLLATHALHRAAFLMLPAWPLLLPTALAPLAAIGWYALVPRSRFYGNTAPLCFALILAIISPAWALPLALLFLAGIAADALESSREKLWRLLFWTLAALQIVQPWLSRGL